MKPNENLPEKFEFNGHIYRRTEKTKDIIPLEYIVNKDDHDIFVSYKTEKAHREIFLLNNHGEGLKYRHSTETYLREPFIEEAEPLEEKAEFDATIELSENPQVLKQIKKYFSKIFDNNETPKKGEETVSYSVEDFRPYKLNGITPSVKRINIKMEYGDRSKELFCEQDFPELEATPICDGWWNLYIFEYESELYLVIND